MLNLFLFIITLVAGLCSAQVSEFSECATVNEIATQHCEEHLHYLKALNSDSYNFFMDIAKMRDALMLVNSVVVEKACNNSDHLGMYYQCVYTNLSACLEAVNSSQVMVLPEPTRSSNAVKNLCNNQKDINSTCYNIHIREVENCIQKQAMLKGPMPVPEAEAVEYEEVDLSHLVPEELNTYHTHNDKRQNMICTFFDSLLECYDREMSSCKGYESVIRAYSLGLRPKHCTVTSSSTSVGPLGLASLFLVFLCSRLL